MNELRITSTNLPSWKLAVEKGIESYNSHFNHNLVPDLVDADFRADRAFSYLRHEITNYSELVISRPPDDLSLCEEVVELLHSLYPELPRNITNRYMKKKRKDQRRGHDRRRAHT